MPQQFNVRRIAIIGAGPGGLAAAKYLRAEDAFGEIDIFEQKGDVGGTWLYTSENIDSLQTVPQTSPHHPVEEPVRRNHQRNGEPVFVAPIYDKLETNIPISIMRTSDLDWPEGTQLFPPYEEVMDYIREYSKDVYHLIKFHTQVLDVKLLPGGPHDRWAVKTRDLAHIDGVEVTREYDAIVVANGHFAVPYLPDIKGIRQWNEKYPGIISHAKSFRSAEPFRGKKVIIVGSSASATDICAQISFVCKGTVLASERSKGPHAAVTAVKKDPVPEIVEFLDEGRSVKFADGRIESNVDAIVFGTGYLYSLPFLSSIRPSLISDGQRIQHLYQHIFFNRHPTIAFIGAMVKVVPFLIAEGQSAAISKVWANKIQLPSQGEMELWEQERIAVHGSGKKFQMLDYPQDADYVDELHGWVLSAGSSTNGKIPPVWGERERWIRAGGRFFLMRAAFANAGEARHKVTRMEELGFNFEEWKKDQGEVERESSYS